MFDLHIHSTFSDGTDSVYEIIEKVKLAGIDYFSITDHDSAESARYILSNKKLQDRIKELGLTYVPGIEWSCRFDGYKVHILAYDYDPEMPEIKKFEKQLKAMLDEKNHERLQKLNEAGYVFSEKSLDLFKNKSNLRKLDFANALIDDGYANTIDEAIKIIKKSYASHSLRLDGREVISTLSKLGVKMVWAHSLGGIGEKRISFEEVDGLISKMKECGLAGLECYYSLYTEQENANLAEIARKYNLFMTCGSDYHGKNKTVKLLEMSCDGTKAKQEDIIVNQIFEHTI